ncbi:MAG: rhodanese-like domain-containing protein [Myxococcota bacterium]
MDTSTLILIGALVAIAFLVLSRRPSVSGPDAWQLVQNGARLVDVRTRDEFANGHLPGALNLPLQELSTRIAELGGSDTQVVLYCASGSRSGVAARMLKSKGWKHVWNLGASTRWPGKAA